MHKTKKMENFKNNMSHKTFRFCTTRVVYNAYTTTKFKKVFISIYWSHDDLKKPERSVRGVNKYHTSVGITFN